MQMPSSIKDSALQIRSSYSKRTDQLAGLLGSLCGAGFIILASVGIWAWKQRKEKLRERRRREQVIIQERRERERRERGRRERRRRERERENEVERRQRELTEREQQEQERENLRQELGQAVQEPGTESSEQLFTPPEGSEIDIREQHNAHDGPRIPGAIPELE